MLESINFNGLHELINFKTKLTFSMPLGDTILGDPRGLWTFLSFRNFLIEKFLILF